MDKEPNREPTFAERLEAQAQARRRMLERFKPRPHVPAPVMVVVDDALERIRAERRAERERRKATRVYVPRQPDPVVVAEAREAQQASMEILRQEPAVPTVYYTKSRALSRTNAETKALLLELQDGRCYLCGHRFSLANPPTTDHVTPRARRGANRHNRLMACGPCNWDKDDRQPHPCELIYLSSINLMLACCADAPQLQ